MYACLYLPPRSVTNRAKPLAIQASSALVQLAREHSPRVELHGEQLVMLDVRGMGRLWGSPPEIGAMLRRTAADRGLMVRVAVAATRMAALLATQGRSGLTVIPPGSEAGVLAALPLSALKKLAKIQASGSSATGGTSARWIRSSKGQVRPASPSSLVVPVSMLLPIVQRWGLKTLGELAALPADELSGRLGPGGLELQRFARGEDSWPLVPDPVEERFEQTLALEWSIEGLKPLSFVLGRVLEPLCIQLEQCGVGVGTVHVRLTLVSRETHDRTLQFPAPLRDPRVLRTLILLDLEAHPPSAGIERVTVTADPVPERTTQFSLLERVLPSSERLSTLLARLVVLMGDRRCGAPAVVDSHRPGAFEIKAFQPEAVRDPRTRPTSSPQRLAPVLRRFRMPVAAQVAVECGRPVRVATGRHRSGGGAIVASAGPWRSSGQWWESEAQAASTANACTTLRSWDRDEWDVALSDGGVYLIFQDRTSHRWFMEGMVD